ncbi:MAG: hypothetical protein EXS01_06510 [Phycisphaerales bacterium]|nr:hypothetical protein [Phycisphaerales bacterium]
MNMVVRLEVRSAAVVMLAGSALIAGCQGTALTPSPSDALRIQVRSLSERVTSLEAQKTQLEQQLASVSLEAQQKSGSDPEILAATPQVAAVQIGGRSHVDLGANCTARVYLDPSDGLGRFIQIVGSVRVSVFELTAAGESRRLGHGEYSPLQLRDCWRGGLMGSHYTIELPLAAEGWSCAGAATANLEFTDGLTGRTFTAQRELPLQK